jgi:toxin-antitoxin system PIN domain toxin
MIIPDVNLLLYAYDSDSAFHAKAAAWWQDCLSGPETVGMPPVVIFGFIRIGSHPRVFQNPMTPAELAENVRSWLAQPVVQILESGSDHLDRVLKLLEAIGAAGNLVTDAQIAAFAIEYGADLHTEDSDFMRFPGLQWKNPLTGIPRKSAY